MHEQRRRQSDVAFFLLPPSSWEAGERRPRTSQVKSCYRKSVPSIKSEARERQRGSMSRATRRTWHLVPGSTSTIERGAERRESPAEPATMARDARRQRQSRQEKAR